VKIKSFRELETYIYTSIILPLKDLNLPALNYSSPLLTDEGDRWEFFLQKTPVRGEFRRNYQRSLAQQNRNWQIVLKAGEGSYPVIVGEYNLRSHWVKLWQEPFKRSGAMPVFGKLYEALDTNTPFTKVLVESDEPPEYEARDSNFPIPQLSRDQELETRDVPF